VAILASLANIVGAQTIPATVAAAEAEGAGFAHADTATSVQSLFTGAPFGGSGDRRCLRTTPGYPIRAGSSSSLPLQLRSGDFIVRGALVDSWGLQADKKYKVLWIPLHGAAMHGPPLLVRAVRIGHPADSVRFSVGGLARGVEGTGPLYGYPSEVRLPSAGQWLVVATAKDDWGCFVLDVA
jgi:hypothetical protein